MSSVYHPQTDNQTEVFNRVIEQYLRAFVHKKPASWGKFLHWVEWSYNTLWHSGSRTTPYEITFGKKPFNVSQYISSSSPVEAVNDLLTNREAIFKKIRKKLIKVQEVMKTIADTKRRNVNFEIGDWVMVILRPYRQSTVLGPHSKLAKRFYGLFQILARIGSATYKLQLPKGAKIHLVFHCSMLKKFHHPPSGDPTPFHPLPTIFIDNQHVISPLTILDTLLASDTANSKLQVLVQWQGFSPDDTSWEDQDQLRADYNLEDKVLLEGEGDDSSTTMQAPPETRPKKGITTTTYLKDFVN